MLCSDKLVLVNMQPSVEQFGNDCVVYNNSG